MKLKEQFERSKSISVEEKSNGDTLIYINRKSRFIMKDAKSFIQKVDESDFDLNKNKLILSLTGPVCSKSRNFLESKGIIVEHPHQES